MKRNSAAILSIFVLLSVLLSSQPVIPGPNTWARLGLVGTVTVLAIAPSNPNVLYAYKTEGKALLKSTDAGKNWNPVLAGVSVVALDVHPANPDIVIASVIPGISESDSLRRTDDGGTTWLPVSSQQFVEAGVFYSIQFHPANPDIIDLVGPYYIYRSVDGGANWSDITGDICFA